MNKHDLSHCTVLHFRKEGSTKVIFDISFCVCAIAMYVSGLSSLGVLGVPWHTQILADQLILFEQGGTDYAHLIPTGTPGFSELPTALTPRDDRPAIMP